MQNVAWIVTLILMSVVILLFWFVVYNSSKKREDYDPIVKKWYKIRSIFGLSLIAIIIIMTFVTLRHLPFDKPVYSAGVEPVVVDVKAMQFGFQLSQTEFKAGQPIEFDVISADVNHGFGLYDANNQVLAQTQAMPDYTNKLYYTFDKPGTYQILCIEYCGLGHHQMMAKITVK